MCTLALRAPVLLLATLAMPATGATLTWNNVNGDWAVGGNWTPAGPPGTGDIAVVNVANPQLASDTTILGLNQGGGTVSGAGNLTVTGSSSWTGGSQSGTGSTTYSDTLAITGPGLKVLVGGRTLNLQGTTTWNGNTATSNNAIRFWNGATINNSGTFNDDNPFDSFIEHNVGGPHAFNNIGTFNKNANTTTLVDSGVAFNNSGTVNVNNGVFLPGGGGMSTGTFNIADGAKLEFRNGNHTLDGVTTSGAGMFQISTENVGVDAIVTVNGGTHTTPFLLSGSTMTGTDATFQGPATWTGGTITGVATTTFANTLAMTGTATRSISGGRTVHAGNTTWTGNTGANNNIAISGGGTFTSSGTFTDSNPFQSSITTGSGGGTFNNEGTYDKQSATTTAISTAFNNSGTVNVDAGLFLPGGGGTSAGTFNIADGAKLEFRNGNHTLNNVTTSGAGTLQISTDLVGADAVVTVNGGTHTTPFLLSGSTMGGTDATFQGPVTWTGGAISGAAATTFTNDVAISGSGLKVLSGGRTLNLQATTTWSGNTGNNNNAIRFWNGATINNHGTFNDNNDFDSFIEHNVGGPHTFNNVGTYNKNADTVTTVDLGVTFNNTGALNVNAGTFRTYNAQDNQGTITTAAAATFVTMVNADFQNHGILQGNGTYDPQTGRAVLNSGEVRPGTAGTVGALTIAGNFTQAAAGTFDVDLASLTNFDTMDVVGGNLALDGILHVSSLGNYNPVLGDRFTIITFDDGVVDASDLAGVFANLVSTGFAPGLQFGVEYFAHSVDLTVIAGPPVPAPPAVWLLGTGLAGLLWRLRRHT